MSGAKHTPGPWALELVNGFQVEHGASVRVVKGHDLSSIGAVFSWKNDPVYAEEAKANARLIAAAPDLLEALEKYEAAFDELFAQCCSNPVTNAWGKPVNLRTLNDAHAMAGCAVAKSRGGQQ